MATQVGNALTQGIINSEAPSIAQYGQQYAQAQAGLAGLPSLLNLQGQQLQQSTNLQGQQLQNQQTGLNLQGQQLNTEAQTAAAQQNAEIGQYNAQMGQYGVQQTQEEQAFYNTNTGLANSQQYLGAQEGAQAQNYGLTQQQLALQQGNLNYQLPLAQQASAGQAAASGASNTVGQRNAQDTLQQQYGYNSAQLGIQGQQAGVANTLANAGFTNQQQSLNLQGVENTEQQQNAAATLGYQEAGTTAGQIGEVAGYQGQQAGYQNQGAQLANQAASLGISQEQLQAQLASGMTQIGIQGQAQQDQLMQQASQAQAGEAQGLGAVYSNIGALTGLGPAAFTQSMPQLYGGG